MIKTNFNLKNILTTSSTLILVCLYNFTTAAAPVTTGGDVTFDSNTNWNPNAPVDNDYIIYGGAHSVNANVNNRIIQAIDLNASLPGLFTVSNSLDMGAIGDSGGGGGGLNIRFAADSNILNLTGTAGGLIVANDYTRLSSVDFNGLNSILRISAANANFGTNFYGNKNGAFGQVSGTIEIDANNVTLSGVFEDTMVRRVVNLNVNSGKSLTLDTDLKLYNELQLGDLATLTVRAGRNLSARNIKSNPNGTQTELSQINFEGDSIVDSFIGLNDNSRVGYVNIQGAGSTVRFNKSIVLSQKLTIGGNSEAIFSDGANLLSSYVDGTTPAGGTLTFLGDSTISGNCGATNPLGAININGTGKTVSFQDNLFVNGNVNIASDAIAQFGGNLKAIDIRGVTPSRAIVEFINNDENAYFQGDLGAGGRLASLKISNRSIDLQGSLSTDNIEFTNPNTVSSLKLSGGSQIDTTNITSTSNQRLHNLWINSDQNITGNIGTQANPLGVIKFISDKQITVNTSSFYTDVTTATTQTGKVNFIKQDSFSYSLGEAGAYLSEIKFSENAQVRGSAYSDNIIINTGKTASFVKRTRISNGSEIIPYIRTITGIRLLGPNSTAYFGDSSTLYSDSSTSGNVSTALDGEGQVIFEGNADVRVDIGAVDSRLERIEFMANSLDKAISLSRNMYARDVIFNNASVVIQSGGTIDGNVNFNSTLLNINQNILTFSGGEASFTGNPTFKIFFNNASNSHISVKGSDSVVKLSEAQSLTFDITDNSSLPPKAGRTFNFFQFDDGGALVDIDVSKVIIKDSNPFVTWTYQNGLLFQNQDVMKGLTSIANAARGKFSSIPTGFNDIDTDGNSAAARFIHELVAISSTDPARAGEALDRVINPVDPAHEIMVNNVNHIQSAIFTSRIDNNEQFKFQLVKANGISAGNDLGTRFGAWISPFYSQAVQKSKSNIIGFKSKAGGGSLGADTMINDNLTLGIAGTVFNTRVSYKDQRSGDKSKIDSLLFSLYGLQTLSNNWFIEGIASAGTNKIKNSKNRLIASGIEQALGSYTSQSYGLELKTGYNYNLTNKIVVTPNVGLKYNHFTGNSYQEQGTSAQNLALSKRKYDKVEGYLGLQLAQMIEVQEFKLIPQAHGAINYNFNQKSPSVNVSLDGLNNPIISRSDRSNNVLYNVGGGVKATAGRMEYELSYEAYLAPKYISHQGSFKVRVNF